MKRISKILLASTIALPIHARGIETFASQTIASHYVGTSGPIVGSGPVSQHYLAVNIGNNLVLEHWSNYDFKDEKLHEADIYLTANRKFGKISGSTSFQFWGFPSKLLGSKPDYVLDSHLTYSGIVNADLRYTNVMTNGLSFDSDRLEGKVSKTFADKKGQFVRSITPSIHTAYHDGFYGMKKFGQFSPGLSFGFGNEGTWSIDAYIKRQFAVDNNFKSITHGGISFSIRGVGKKRK